MMPLAAGYLIKLAVCLIAVYLFYALVLRRLTFYAWNRWYLLGYSIAAFFMPLINIAPVLDEASWRRHVVVEHIPSLEVLATNAAGGSDGFWQNVSVWYFVLAAVVCGMVIMGIRFAVRYRALVRIRRSARLLSDESVRVYAIDKPVIPFSFGNAIYINPQLHNAQELEQIIHHEFIHVKQKHTVDMLFGELLCILNWYNPFAWMIRKAIRQNLEFMADRGVLQNGVDKKQYQYLLLHVTTANQYTMSNHFNFTSLKKRITMMNCTRSARIQLGRFLFLLPILVVMLLAFRSNQIINHPQAAGETSPEANAVSAGTPNSVNVAADTTPKRFTGTYTTAADDAPKRVAATYTFAADTTPRRLTGTYTFAADPAPKRITATYTYAADTTPKRVTGTVRYQTEKREDSATVKGVVLSDSNSPANFDSILIVIDKVVQRLPEKAMKQLPPSEIESISVLKGEHARAAYGDKLKGKTGVIEITTRSGSGTKPAGPKKEYDMLEKIVQDTATTSDKSSALKIRGMEGDLVLYVVDGKQYSAAEFKKLNLPPNIIASIDILKGDTGKAIYGDKAKNGVIVIKTK